MDAKFLPEIRDGWTIQHCGHPTANWPYYLEHPDYRLIVVSHNGLGFKTKDAARFAVNLIVNDQLKIDTTEQPFRIGLTAFGEVVL